MQEKPNDLLLFAGQVLTIIAQGAMALSAFAITIALPALLIFREDVIDGFSEKAGTGEPASALLVLAGVLVFSLLMVVTLFFFFDYLRRIVATVGAGDPFAPINARRLNLMGWLMLGAQLLLLPLTTLGVKLLQYTDDIEDIGMSFDSGLDLTGILLVIILFILARVFKHGAAMRDDLEGTV